MIFAVLLTAKKYKNMKKFTITVFILCFRSLSVVVALFFVLKTNAQVANTDTTDTGVLINGVVWATRNVDAPGKFAQNPEDIGMIYQYNIRVGWRYTWEYSGILGTDGSTVWNTTPAPYSPVWEEDNDPCPTGWRVPTPTEMQSLIDAGSYLVYGSTPLGSWTPHYRVYGSNEYGVVDNTISLNLIGIAGHDGRAYGNSAGNFYWCDSASYKEIITCYIMWNSATTQPSGLGEAFGTMGNLVRCVKKYTEENPCDTCEENKINNIAIEIVKIYPNPTQNELKIKNEELKINNIEITDINGKILSSFKFSTNKIDVSFLSQGIYLLKINTDKGIIAEKFIKK